MKLPSDDWFVDLFKRYNDVIEEEHLEPKKSSTFAAPRVRFKKIQYHHRANKCSF